MINNKALLAEVATNRFGLGARPGELKEASDDPRSWLISQLEQPQFTPGLPNLDTASKALMAHREAKKQAKAQQKANATAANATKTQAVNKSTKFKNSVNKVFRSLIHDGIHQSIVSEQSFSWRLLEFFSNHFSVSTANRSMVAVAPLLEKEALAPNLFGQFEDMLIAATQHPAMLLYLNNEKSFGPDSRLGRRMGFNENLAREILELHTLGVDGGYNQQDVHELALAITGWSITNPKTSQELDFVFRDPGHQPGARTILGKRYADGDVSQAENILRDLARHPSTAKHVSFKLAQYIVSDSPPDTVVNAMTAKWLATDGNLREVITEMITHDAAWQFDQQKLKTPREFIVSVFRAYGENSLPNNLLINSLTELGQRPFNAGSPAGYSQVANGWDGADALMARIDWSAKISSRIKGDPLKISQQALGSQLTSTTATAIKRAESREQALALLFMSPEFQRR